MPINLPPGAQAPYAEFVATIGQHFDENQRVRSLGLIGHGDGTFTLRFLATPAASFVRVHQQIADVYGAADFSDDIDCRAERQQEIELDAVDGLHVWLVPLWDDQGTLRAFDGVTGPDHMALVPLDGNTLGGLGDVDITLAEDGDYLRHDGTSWKDVSISQILADLLTVDGAGSGLDADLLDGEHASDFADAVHTHVEADITDLDHYDNADFDARLATKDLTDLLEADAADLIGTLADARLSSNVPLLDAVLNTFTGDLTVEGDITAGANLAFGAILFGGTRFVLQRPGDATPRDPFEIVTGAANTIASIRRGTGVSQLRWAIQDDTSRWIMEVTTDDDDGDDDGGDLRFLGRADEGTALSTASLVLDRAGPFGNDTCMLIRHSLSGTPRLIRVRVGSADSGDAGNRVLQVAN
jgi:hypothetical protein